MSQWCADCRLQAVVHAVSAWIVALEAADPDHQPMKPKDDLVLFPDFFLLDKDVMLQFLVGTITLHLGGQQQWHEFAQRGLRSLLIQLSASMQQAATLSKTQSPQDRPVQLGIRWYFTTLASASRFCSTHPLVLFCHEGSSDAGMDR